jgi:26S proteasome regulatory subunit N1
MAEEKMADAAENGGEKKPDVQKKKKLKPEEDKDADLSEEDLELKKNLELMVTRIGEGDPGVQALALQSVANEIRSATTSMTSVPKPLKFLRSHYQTLVDVHERTPDSDVRRQLADVLSVLAITTSKEGDRACLRYRLQGQKVCCCRAHPSLH